MCLDYRALNAKTIKQNFPMPKASRILDDIAKGKVFSLLDLTKGYYQAKLSEDDVEKTAFALENGTKYEFLRLPFGLRNAPMAFAEVLSPIFAGLPFVRLYADDLIVFSESAEEHYEHLKQLLTRVMQHGIRLNPAKSVINQKEIIALGHVVRHGCIALKESRIET